ncbi:MAG: hypothetical protein MUC49_02375 [Raineya sp.]|jgi:hypothetical protein|nr:hypothetical protein [Raineya sp.]
MESNISIHPTKKHFENGNAYDIQRKFVETSFIFNTDKKFVSLVGIVKHYAVTEEKTVPIVELDKVAEITATNHSQVYANNGSYIEYLKDEHGNIVYDNTDEQNPKPVILNPERGVIGEYQFFEALRNMPVSINSLIQNVIQRHDGLKRFD